MSAYVVAQIDVTDAALYADYIRVFGASFGDFDGAVLVADNAVEVVEGEWPCSRTAVIRFNSMAEARRWYHSETYQAAARFRHAGTRTNLIFAQGLDR